jgi:hypothetical protein
MTPATKIRSGGDPYSTPGGSGAISDIGDFREPEETPIKFGSFSLGDVFEREISKLGRFVFRNRNSSGEAAAKFVEDFVRLQRDTSERLNQAEGAIGVQLEKETNIGVQNANVHLKQAETAGPSEPKYPYDTCISQLFSHSWSDPVGYWVWVKKGTVLEAADLGLGFPARSEEIQRFGHRSRRVVRVRASNIDERSFAEVVAMNPGRGRGQMQRGGAAPRPSGRGGPGRSGDDRGYNDFERESWNKDWSSQEGDRERPYNYNANSSGFQGGYREERPRYEQQRINPNKRQFDDRERVDWEEQELRAKLKRGQDERRANEHNQWNRHREEAWEARKGKVNLNQAELCHNCNLTSHLRKDCRNPPFCYCCKKSGHRSSACLEKRGLKMCGFGIPGQGFYSIHLPVEREAKSKEVLGLMHIMSGQASLGIVERELKHLFTEVNKWIIKQLKGENKYMITFPNEDMRYQVAKFRSFEFETANVKAKVVPTDLSMGADDKLETVWVKAYNFPPISRKEEVVREIAYLVGEPEEVDIKTLEGFGPIRIKISCRDAKQVRGETQVYFNKESRGIRWEVIEEDRDKSGNTSKFDRVREEEDDDEENEEGEFQDESDREVNNNKEGTATSVNKQGNKEGTSSQKHKGQQAGREGGHAPTKGVIIEEGGTKAYKKMRTEPDSNQSKNNKSVGNKNEEALKSAQEEEDPLQTQQSNTEAAEREGEGEELCEEELVDYDEDPAIAEKIEMDELEKKVESRAQMLLNKAAVKIPVEMAMTEGREEVEKVSSTPSTDEEIDWENVWSNLGKPAIPTILKEKQSGSVGVRRSERNKHDTEKIQDKAEALKNKNNDITGNTPASAVLNSVDSNLLEKIALSSNIKLGDAPEKINASISTIQAKELAKVALMELKRGWKNRLNKRI